MNRFIVITCLSILPLLPGCATNLTSNLVPGASLDELGKIFVVRFEPDKRQLNSIIADKLALMGHPAVAGEADEVPNDIDTLVTYRDNWHWDITMYMIRINIQFRNRKTKELIASGESYRTSLARKNPEEMIYETLVEILKRKSSRVVP
jgi:hypothetical protein